MAKRDYYEILGCSNSASEAELKKAYRAKAKELHPDRNSDKKNAEEDFKAVEIAQKLKLQLKKLELIRLLSDQLLKKKRLGIDILTRGMKGNVRTSINSNYSVSFLKRPINVSYLT